MKVGLRDNQDFWAGVMLIAIGVTAVVIARNYPFGTSLRMGPGYFPTVLGGVLTLFGLYLLVKGVPQLGEDRAGLVAARADRHSVVACAVRHSDDTTPASFRR